MVKTRKIKKKSSLPSSPKFFPILKSINNLAIIKIIIILSLSAIIASLVYLSNYFLSPSLTIILSLSLLAIGINLSVYLLKRNGYALLFYLSFAFYTFNLMDLGIIGWRKILLFFLAGIIFELIILIPLIKSFSAKVVLATIFSITSIPFILAFLISTGLAVNFPLPLVNLILVVFVLSGLTSTLSLLLWSELKNFKQIIKLESYLKTL